MLPVCHDPVYRGHRHSCIWKLPKQTLFETCSAQPSEKGSSLGAPVLYALVLGH